MKMKTKTYEIDDDNQYKNKIQRNSPLNTRQRSYIILACSYWRM